MTRRTKPQSASKPKAGSEAETAAEPVASESAGYTIDELAAASGVPSRTIRYYQSKGALAKPEIRGRVAYYGDRHRERLDLIAQLQDRGLSIKAIRDLVQQIDKGEISLNEWLGLEEQLQKPWLNEEPQLVSEAELYELAGGDRPGLIGDLTRTGMVERHGDRYLVPIPGLLRIARSFESAGISLETSVEGGQIIRKHMEAMAGELVKLYLDRLGDELDDENLAENVAAALNQLRPLGIEAVQIMFSRAVEGVLRRFVESGKVTDLSTRRKRK